MKRPYRCSCIDFLCSIVYKGLIAIEVKSYFFEQNELLFHPHRKFLITVFIRPTINNLGHEKSNYGSILVQNS